MTSAWSIRGAVADARDLAEALALARQYKIRVARQDSEARARDAEARGVGRAVRKMERERHRFSIGCKPASKRGRCQGRVRLRRYGSMLGLKHPAGHSSMGGLSSFHLKFTPRGLGGHRRNKTRPYTRGEAVRTIRYIFRESAREADLESDGIVSNISQDVDDIASLFSALEELELVGGRANANVYTSVIISLPHELAGGREDLLREICQSLAEMDLPFAAALHEPDPNGDQRNYHAHIIFSWRPFKITDEGFAFSDMTSGAGNNPDFVIAFRERAAQVMNQAMADAGHKRRFTAEKRERPNAQAADDKRTPGQNASKSRRGNIELMKEEKSVLGKLADALARARTVVTDVLALDPAPDLRELAELERREAELKPENVRAAARANCDISAVTATRSGSAPDQQVSHEKWGHGYVFSEWEPVDPPAISHEKSASPSAADRETTPLPGNPERPDELARFKADANRSGPNGPAASEQSIRPVSPPASVSSGAIEASLAPVGNIDPASEAARPTSSPPPVQQPEVHTPSTKEFSYVRSYRPFHRTAAEAAVRSAVSSFQRNPGAYGRRHRPARSTADLRELPGSRLGSNGDNPRMHLPGVQYRDVDEQGAKAGVGLRRPEEGSSGRAGSQGAVSVDAPDKREGRVIVAPVNHPGPPPRSALPTEPPQSAPRAEPARVDSNVSWDARSNFEPPAADVVTRTAVVPDTPADQPAKSPTAQTMAVNAAKPVGLLPDLSGAPSASQPTSSEDELKAQDDAEPQAGSPSPRSGSSADLSAAAVDELIEGLRKVEILPLRRCISDEEIIERGDRFLLVESLAVPEDEELIRRAAQCQSDERVQAVLRASWEAMLRRLRSSIMGRSQPLPKPASTTDLTKDQRLQAALTASHGDQAMHSIVDEARSLTNERLSRAIDHEALVERLGGVIESDRVDDPLSPHDFRAADAAAKVSDGDADANDLLLQQAFLKNLKALGD